MSGRVYIAPGSQVLINTLVEQTLIVDKQVSLYPELTADVKRAVDALQERFDFVVRPYEDRTEYHFFRKGTLNTRTNANREIIVGLGVTTLIMIILVIAITVNTRCG